MACERVKRLLSAIQLYRVVVLRVSIKPKHYFF